MNYGVFYRYGYENGNYEVGCKPCDSKETAERIANSFKRQFKVMVDGGWIATYSCTVDMLEDMGE